MIALYTTAYNIIFVVEYYFFFCYYCSINNATDVEAILSIPQEKKKGSSYCLVSTPSALGIVSCAHNAL